MDSKSPHASAAAFSSSFCSGWTICPAANHSAATANNSGGINTSGASRVNSRMGSVTIFHASSDKCNRISSRCAITLPTAMTTESRVSGMKIVAIIRKVRSRQKRGAVRLSVGFHARFFTCNRSDPKGLQDL
ncbi:MAG: hypothetical protein HND47_07885 [Chloroflexi bacterium]|nr:hypothetical protein [Chloroflexota bacterium]